MTFRCLDCTQPIEGDPWWFDPFGVNRRAQENQITGAVSQRPDAKVSTFSQGVLGKADGSERRVLMVANPGRINPGWRPPRAVASRFCSRLPGHIAPPGAITQKRP